MTTKTQGKIIQVTFDVDENLWADAKIQAIKNKINLKDWLAIAIQNQRDNENKVAQ